MEYLDFLSKINSKEKYHFSEEELQDFWEGELISDIEDIELIEEKEGPCDRWTHSDSRVWRIGKDFFECYADIANTEMQENQFWRNPIKVIPVKKAVIITDYIPIFDNC